MTAPQGDDARDDHARWLLLSMAPPPSGEAILLVDALRRLGARSVEREGGRVVALFPPRDDPEALAADASVAVRASTSLRDPEITWRWLSPAESAARGGTGHPPRRITDRLVVVAVTAAAKPPRRAGTSDRVIRLEPSTAFGSAEHPTTRACLRLLDGAVRAGDRVLDVGAGSGILAIAAVVLGAARATALEADPVSCAAARRNAHLNGVARRVRVREAEVVPGSLPRRRWQGIVANLQAGLLRALMPDLAAAASAGGWVIVSGVLRGEREAVIGAVDAAGLRLEAEALDDGWWTGRLAR